MITLYTKENCPNCKMIEKQLIASNKSFDEKSLDNEDTLVELITEGALLKSAPILKINDKFIYDVNEMKEGIKNAE